MDQRRRPRNRTTGKRVATYAKPIAKALFAFVTPLAFSLALPVSGFGQAWVPPKGEGSIAVSYQNLFMRNHFDDHGGRLDRGHIRSSASSLQVEYGLTDKLALDASLPYIISKYYGPHPHPGPTDNGKYHGTFQDFRFGVRYNLWKNPLVVTPFFETIIPSNNYPFFAHSAAGARLREFLFGVNVGRRLDPILPRAYFQTRYSYALVEPTIGFHPTRNRLEGELGYFVTNRLSLSFLESLQITHGGLDFSDVLPAALHPDTFPFHDQIFNHNHLNLGAGAAFILTDSLSIFAAWMTSVWGKNGHAIRTGIVAGMTWNFGTRWGARKPPP